MPRQRDLAERAGLHKNTISKLELGHLRRPGSKWGEVEDALGWPRGKLVAMYRDIVDHPDRVPAEVVERAVLDTLNEAAPHVTVRQARRIADGIVERLERDGYLLGR
jgi:hypothetical protein